MIFGSNVKYHLSEIAFRNLHKRMITIFIEIDRTYFT